MARQDALVDTEWLEAHLNDPQIRIVDASWYLPAQGRDAHAEYLQAHIPHAVRFDLDATSNPDTDLPHMLPSTDAFERAVGGLGIGNDDLVVVYDGAGLFSAARVWWTFRAFGHDDVRVLDGGLPKWRSEGRPLESGGATSSPRTFSAVAKPALVRAVEDMRTTTDQVLDARSRGRFEGTAPEPRPGLRSGHIPGSRNVPFESLLEDGCLRATDELQAAFRRAGVDTTQAITTTCGSGVTAAILALALFVLGRRDVAVYDGSWTEWGGRSDTPVSTGP